MPETPAGSAAPASAPASAVAPPETLPPLSAFVRLWHDPADEPHGLVFAVQEIFPDALARALPTRIKALPAAIREARSPERSGEPAPGLEKTTNGAAADLAVGILVGLLGCVRANVCDAAHEALVAVGREALPVLDRAADRGFGYVVDQSYGRNTLELFGERLVWEKMIKKTAMTIDPKRGNIIDRLVAKLFT